MARILLIKAEGLGKMNYAVVPPMGILYLSSVLRSKRGHEVRLLDLRTFQHPRTVFRGHVDTKPFVAKAMQDFQPHLVGISAITVESNSLHSVARTVKDANKDIPVIAGGPHPTAYPGEVLDDPNIDYVVFGEGEETILELSDAVLDGGDVSRVKGVGFKDDGVQRHTPSRPSIVNLDALPFPAWDLLNTDPYAKFRGMASLGLRRYMSLFTSRSCPYHCIYCHNMFGKEFRARSPENVVEEVRFLMKTYGVDEFEIYDDIFNLDRQRTKEIFHRLAGMKTRFSFPNGLRSDLLDEETLRIMRDGGVNFISLAVETASPRLQKLIRKNLNLDKVWRAIEDCVRLRIFTRGFFMLGFPTETRQEIHQTISFACNSALHTSMFFIVTPFQGTEIENMYKERVKEYHTNFKDYDYFTGMFNLSEIPDEELYRTQRTATIRFNFNSTRLWHIVRDFPRKKHLLLHACQILYGFYLHAKRGN